MFHYSITVCSLTVGFLEIIPFCRRAQIRSIPTAVELNIELTQIYMRVQLTGQVEVQ